MFEACTAQGFFLLDLKDDSIGEELIQLIDSMFGIAKDIFDLSPEEKAKYHLALPHNLVGYKAIGVAKTETGEPDRNEYFQVGQDDLLGNKPPTENPQIVNDNRATMVHFLDRLDPIVKLVMSILDTQLGIPPGKLSSLQRRDKLSGTNIRMIRYPPQIADRRTSMVQHTDFGTLTVLSNVLGGLEILEQDSPSDPGEWRYAKPEPNCVIINLGDALVEWTGAILRSGLHRVTYAPGQQANCTRLSIAYLVRPERDASMKRLVGGCIPPVDGNGEEDLDLTAWEWEMKKMVALKDGTEIMKSRGGREFGRVLSQKPIIVS